MPDDALPQPWAATPDLIHYERVYQDVLRRPLRGSVKITGAQRAEHGDLVVVPTSVTVPLVGGRLAVDLPAGTYELAAALSSPDGDRVREADTVTLE